MRSVRSMVTSVSVNGPDALSAGRSRMNPPPDQFLGNSAETSGPASPAISAGRIRDIYLGGALGVGSTAPVFVGVPAVPAGVAARLGLLDQLSRNGAGEAGWRALFGLPGYGKSILAALFAKQIRAKGPDVPDVVWLDCTNDTSLVESIRQVARTVTMDAHSGRALWVDSESTDGLEIWFRNWVATRGRPLLVILDGWDGPVKRFV